jgi:hypothetical protein
MDTLQNPQPADIFAEMLDFREAAFLRFDAMAEQLQRIEQRVNGIEQEALMLHSRMGTLDVRLMAIDTGISVLNRRL